MNPKNISMSTARKFDRCIISILAISWALFQLALPRFLILDTFTIRAIHLAFAITLVFLTIPFSRDKQKILELHSIDHFRVIDFLLAILSVASILYLVFDFEGIAARSGRPIMRDIVFAFIGILLILEASRRAIGLPLGIIVVIFTIYAFLGPYMPSFLAFRGCSLTKYLNQVVLSSEGIYGIPLDVSATTVFLFVLFGSMLEKTGAGHFFNDLSLSLFGKYKGGPAKAAVVSSGLTGLVSGSSIANVVTTGTFTIPLMKKVGYPAKIAAATEVAASTNGQLMPPIMGAAAFIIAEYIGIGYIDVIKAAAIPAIVSYFALFYITHLEASKLRMKGLSKKDIPIFFAVLKKGFYHLIPILVLIYELIIMRHSPRLSAFNAIIALLLVLLIKDQFIMDRKISWTRKLWHSILKIKEGFEAGSHNMLSVALATATAGIIVGIVNMGIGSMLVQVVEVLSGGNVFLLLFIVAVASLVLGMGLPTTATYIVMASITVPIILEIGANMGIMIPAIAAHLFCFYFGILADDTPPVGLAAYTASAIAKSPPIQTGIQGFIYDLRTAVIPFMFIFNTELVLVNISNFWQILLIFLSATMGALAFTNAVQGWFITRNKIWETLLFLVISLMFFNPLFFINILRLGGSLRYFMFIPAIILYLSIYIIQKKREI
ncbi:TRAP transporter permease [bacterium]